MYKATKIFNLLCCYLFTCRSLSKHILNYASTVWNPHTQTMYISSVEKIQNQGICEAHTCSNGLNPLKNVVELSWPSLYTRWKYLSVITIYDMFPKHISLHFSTFFTAPTRSHSLLYKQCLSFLTYSCRYSFFVNGIFLWNSITFSIFDEWLSLCNCWQLF